MNQDHHPDLVPRPLNANPLGLPSSSTNVSEEAAPVRLQHLSRFLACQSCRRRKLRCDAQRPTCGPCLKRISSVAENAKSGHAVSSPSEHDLCVYDEQIPKKKRTVRSSKTMGHVPERQERGHQVADLQDKIRMLEQQLQDLKMQVPGSSFEAPTNQGRRATFGTSTDSSPGYQGASYQSSVSPTPPLTGPPYGQTSFPPVAPHHPVADSQSMAQEAPSILSPGTSAYSEVYSVNGVEFPVFPTTDTQGPLNGFSGSANIQPMPKPDIWGLNNVPPPSVGFNWFQARDFVLDESNTNRAAYANINLNHQLQATGYSTTLPPVEVLHLLVRRYFNKGNYHAKIMDQGRFWQRLSLPPTHSDYPYLGTLHAICAAASHLTASTGVKRRPPKPLSQSELSSAVTEAEVYDPYDTGSLAFRDHHARLANAIIQVSLAHTHPLYNVLEAMTVLQYHWMHEAFIAKAWITPGMIASLSTYLALNERRLPARAAKMTAVDMRDADMVFWIGFCDEKMACAMSSWPSSYREEDITAFLPTCAGPYGEYLQPVQWMGSPDLYTHHPVQHCDSTIFFIKASILLSRVHTLIRDSKKAQLQGIGVSPQAFQAQRMDIDSFLLSIPRYWKTLFKQDGVDFDMFLCLLGAHIATIHMAELVPLVDPPLPPMYNAGATEAALSVLGLAEALIGTSLDLRVLPMFVPYVLFQSSRVIVGELQQALFRGDQAAAATYDTGLTTFGLAMDLCGEEYSQMFSLVDGVREHALAANRMTELAMTYEKVVTGEAEGGGVIGRSEVQLPGPLIHVTR